MKNILVFVAVCCMATPLISQKITVTNGSVDFVKNQKVLQFVFTYENMTVGKMSETEYTEKKIADYNEKEPGRGERWHEAWKGDRAKRFVPKFRETFDICMKRYGITAGDVNSENAEYRVEINTDFTEPGFNAGIVSRDASINLTCRVFKTASGEEVATVRIIEALADDLWGTDYDTGSRIEGCYLTAGRSLAKFLIKKAKLTKIK